MIKGGMDTGSERRRTLLQREPVDPVSKAIIEHLQKDGRRPYEEIAEAVGIPAEEVESRVADLSRRGVLQIVAVTDPLELGFARQAMLGLTIEGPIRPVVDSLRLIEEVVYVVVTAGDFDVICEVVGNSDAHLLELVTRIRPLPGVKAIHTYLYLETAKQTYTWGVR